MGYFDEILMCSKSAISTQLGGAASDQGHCFTVCEW